MGSKQWDVVKGKDGERAPQVRKQRKRNGQRKNEGCVGKSVSY